MKKILEIFVDGAFSSIRNQGGVGIVMLEDDKKVLEYSNTYKRTSNNQMELGAVIIALRLIKKPYDSIIIYSDSQYVIGCATSDWSKKKNIKLWMEYDKQIHRVQEFCSDVKFCHIKGHTGNYWNEYVDDLARRASQAI